MKVSPMLIHIIAGEDKDSSHVSVAGNEEHVITGQDRKAFGLDDNTLKDCVEKYFGKRPDDVFLCGPTPWGNLYKKYNWKEVSVVAVPHSWSVEFIEAVPTIVKTQSFTNNSNKDGMFTVAITSTVSNSMSNTWNEDHQLSVSQKFEYGVKFLGTGAKGETSASYSYGWGKGGSVSKDVTVGSSSGVQVTLKPGESVQAKLSACRGTMKVPVVYRATLKGGIAVNYGTPYKGHHFWCLDINRVLDAGGHTKSVDNTNTVEVDYYNKSEVELLDKSGSVKLPLTIFSSGMGCANLPATFFSRRSQMKKVDTLEEKALDE